MKIIYKCLPVSWGPIQGKPVPWENQKQKQNQQIWCWDYLCFSNFFDVINQWGFADTQQTELIFRALVYQSFVANLMMFVLLNLEAVQIKDLNIWFWSGVKHSSEWQSAEIVWYWGRLHRAVQLVSCQCFMPEQFLDLWGIMWLIIVDHCFIFEKAQDCFWRIPWLGLYCDWKMTNSLERLGWLCN